MVPKELPEPTRTIRAEIAAHGSIGFDRFMELALYGPGGFYEDPPVGTDPGAAFATSPHVHRVFAALLAAGLREIAPIVGPGPLRIVEIGAGDGTLAAALSEELADLDPDLGVVDRSDGARSALAARGLRVLDALPDLRGVVVANELLDNLPFRLVRVTDGGQVDEIVVRLTDDRLVEATIPAGPDSIGPLPPGAAPGIDLVVPTGALAMIDELATRLRRGFAILIDYAAGPADPAAVHGYRRHRIVDDVLDAPGSTDITAGVDLDAIAARARETGLRVLGAPTQRAALIGLGYEAWITEQLAAQRDLLDRRAGLDAARAWSGRSRASLLVDPAGLGRLRWLVLAADGGGPALELPAWLARALEADRAADA